MQEGSFRCDANVSVRRPGASFGTRREIKNLNSFKFMQQAIDYEVQWQIDLLEDGGTVRQATVLFDPASGETRAMRSKEDAQDYRYFPDPDLLPLEIAPAWIEAVRASMPPLPAALRGRYEGEFALGAYDAQLLTESREKAEYFERTVAAAATRAPHRAAAHWVNGELSALLNERNLDFAASPVAPGGLARLLDLVADGVVSATAAKDVLRAMADGAGDPAAIVEARGLRQISDAGALESAVDAVLERNAKLVEDYRSGKERAFNALVGQVMKATAGKANPAQASAILKRRLG